MLPLTFAAAGKAVTDHVGGNQGHMMVLPAARQLAAVPQLRGARMFGKSGSRGMPFLKWVCDLAVRTPYKFFVAFGASALTVTRFRRRGFARAAKHYRRRGVDVTKFVGDIPHREGDVGVRAALVAAALATSLQPLPWQLPGSTGAMPRIGGAPVDKVVTRPSAAPGDVTFASAWLGERVLFVHTPLARSRKTGRVEPHLPAVAFEWGGYTYELLGSEVRDDNADFRGRRTRSVRAIYVATSGPGLPSISLRAELERLANFPALASVSLRKTAARLELLQSSAVPDFGIHNLKVRDFEIIEEDANIGCGFIPDDMLSSLLGGKPKKRTVALQVRVFAPHLGIFKGVLCAKQGITRIQLPSSMRKVGPATSSSAAEDWACLLVKRVHPSVNNVHVSAWLRGRDPPKTYQPKALAPMICDLWKMLGVPDSVVDAHKAKRPFCEHAWLVGVADPTGMLPAGHIFVTGLLDDQSELFVTRSPCVKPTDGRMLPTVRRRPPGMPTQTWDWLRSLPFGAIVFSTAGGGMPLAETVAAGDLDGDFYFVCWDADVLRHVRPRTLPEPPSSFPSSSIDESQGEEEDWLASVQAHMTDVSVLQEQTIIGKLYAAMRRKAGQSPAGMDDPDAMAFANAYLRMIDYGKHGGDIGLPSHLRSEVGL